MLTFYSGILSEQFYYELLPSYYDLKKELIIDSINITGLSIPARIGVYEWEQKILQTLLVDLSLSIDLRNCVHDKIEETIDYGSISTRIIEYISTNRFALIETVANHIATLLLQEFAISHVKVTVSKPHAVKSASNISVTIHRGAKDAGTCVCG